MSKQGYVLTLLLKRYVPHFAGQSLHLLQDFFFQLNNSYSWEKQWLSKTSRSCQLHLFYYLFCTKHFNFGKYVGGGS